MIVNEHRLSLGPIITFDESVGKVSFLCLLDEWQDLRRPDGSHDYSRAGIP
jgi:hypothetical protein